MSEDRKRILKMVADGKISTAEAEELLDAMAKGSSNAETHFVSGAGFAKSKVPRYLYVRVTGPDTVDVRIPLGLVRAGMRLASLIPKPALDHINSAMKQKGMSFDLSSIKPAEIEELLKHLGEMEISVKAHDGHDVRVYCGE